jgi:hypothetical protein
MTKSPPLSMTFTILILKGMIAILLITLNKPGVVCMIRTNLMPQLCAFPVEVASKL